MKKLLMLLFVFGCIACAQKEAPVVEEAPAEVMSDTTVVDTMMVDEAEEAAE